MKVPINPDYPIAGLTSLDQLMEIAVGVEAEAARRYEDLAARMDGRGEADLAEVFRRLGELERRHERGLAAWAEREGRAPPHPAAFRWTLPETFGDEAETEALDPYRALSIAVRNEERAFAFYTYLAAQASENEAIRIRAEALAREELNHVAQLRQLRRQAWHARGGGGRSPIPVRDPAQLHRLAQGLEDGAAEIGALAARALAESGRPDAAALLRTLAAESRRRSPVAAAAEDFPPPGSAAAEAARAAGVLVPGRLTADGALRLACRDAEEVLEAYLAVADAAEDEAVLATAQGLAEAALARLALIRSQVAGLE